MSDHTYEGMRRVVYDGDDEWDEWGGATFVPVCLKCGRFVRVPKVIRFNGSGPEKDHTDCSRCGKTEMIFEGCW